MKRFVSSLVLAALAAGAFAIEASVVSVTGKAETQSGAAWVALQPGDRLERGSVIQTGFKSEVVLSIKSENQNSTITVSPLTRMTIEQLSENGKKDSASIYLDSGSLKSDIKKTDDRRVGYQVRTPVATASVRGTSFKVTNGYLTTSVATSDGGVAFWPGSVEPEIDSTADSVEGRESDVAPQATRAATSAREISNGKSPRGALNVVAGQSAGALSSGKLVSPQAHFERTTSLVSTSKRAMESESTAMIDAGASPSRANTDGEVAPNGTSSGNLSVRLKW